MTRRHEDTTDQKDWNWFEVSFRMRARSPKLCKKIVQWAFDNYFSFETKHAHFYSQIVSDLSTEIAMGKCDICGDPVLLGIPMCDGCYWNIREG